MFKYEKLGFTLTELLIALTIIGAVAAMSIPSLIENLNKKQMVTQLKSTVSSIQTLTGNQLAINKSKSLIDTDFADPAKLLQEKNFQIAKFCDSASDCWANEYKVLEVAEDSEEDVSYPPSEGETIVLKNGAVINYQKTTTNGIFAIDLNGKDKPNIVGRDVFSFYISEKGQIIDEFQANGEAYNKETSVSSCKSGLGAYCFGEVVRNNWTITY